MTESRSVTWEWGWRGVIMGPEQTLGVVAMFPTLRTKAKAYQIVHSKLVQFIVCWLYWDNWKKSCGGRWFSFFERSLVFYVMTSFTVLFFFKIDFVLKNDLGSQQNVWKYRNFLGTSCPHTSTASPHYQPSLLPCARGDESWMSLRGCYSTRCSILWRAPYL